MTKKEMQAFRQQLLKLERHFKGDVATLEDEAFHETDGRAVGNLSNSPVEDRAELGFDNSSEEVTLRLTEIATARLQEIDAALKRIDDGTFGRCAECGQKISIRRIQTTPFVPQCIECARKAQQGEAVSPGNL